MAVIKGSTFELIVLNRLEHSKLPAPVREYRFHDIRKWRFDFAWPEYKVALECEGGTWSRGRHTRGAGYQGDLEKYNQAAVLGWTVLRYTPGMMESMLAELAVVLVDHKGRRV